MKARTKPLPLPSLDPVAARAWCESMARTIPVRRIEPQGKPYLNRYFTGSRYGPAVFLHHFLASDPNDQVHTHPWGWSLSLILVGGYREQRCSATGQLTVKDYRPGDLNVLRAEDKHRIDLLEQDCWSLFLAGNFVNMWGFDKLCDD
jgi:hypothetical protein